MRQHVTSIIHVIATLESAYTHHLNKLTTPRTPELPHLEALRTVQAADSKSLNIHTKYTSHDTYKIRQLNWPTHFVKTTLCLLDDFWNRCPFFGN